jgi:hypothetical protein
MSKLVVIFIVLASIWGCTDEVIPYAAEADSEDVRINTWDDSRYMDLRRATAFIQAGANFGSGIAISDYHILTAKHLVMKNDKLVDIGDISLIFSFFVSEKIAICSFSEDCINYPHHISIIDDVDLAIITLEYGLNQYINLNKTPYFDLSPEGGDWDHVFPGDDLTMAGYGYFDCVEDINSGIGGGRLKIGDGLIVSDVKEEEKVFEFYESGSIELCAGDSGAPLFRYGNLLGIYSGVEESGENRKHIGISIFNFIWDIHKIIEKDQSEFDIDGNGVYYEDGGEL